MNDIKCPNCGKTIQISEALQHEFGDKIRAEEKIKAKDEIAKAKLQAQNELEKKQLRETIIHSEKEKSKKEYDLKKKKLEEDLQEKFKSQIFQLLQVN